MSVCHQLFATSVMTNQFSSGQAQVVTMDCFYNGKSYTVTEVYEGSSDVTQYDNSDEYLVESVRHDTFDLHILKRLHNQIVAKWDSCRMTNDSYQQMGM